MNFHRFLILWVLLCGAHSVAHAAPPNIVIFLADDSGWGDYSINGNTNLRTPNIDSIARSGATFDRFYVCSVCAPTRAEFLTGRYHPRGGVRGVSTGQERLNLDEKTIADAFKAAGYSTGAFGKWHNGSQWPYHPNARGFGEYYGFTSGHWGEYFDAPMEHNGQPVRGKGFIADDFTTRALDFIERNKATPFLCYVPFNTPHSPWAVPQDDWQRFKNDSVKLRARVGDAEDLDQTRCALAMIENLDRNVGRVLKRLDELKLTDNTIVLYFSDNGPNSWRWNGGMKGRKGSTDEGGVRSTCFVRWPSQINAGITITQIAGTIDLLPTLTALTGVKRVGDKPLDGMDFSALLRGAKAQWPARTLFSHQNGNVSARSQQYRFDNTGALFDMIADPGQTKNIATEKREVAAQFIAAVADWRKDVLGQAAGPIGVLKGKAKGLGLAPDTRPFLVGAGGVAFRNTPLPARDGVAHGSIKRSAPAPNCSYFVNWKSIDDKITWDVEVSATGIYDVTILHIAADAGATVELSFNGSKLTGKVPAVWNPPLYKNQDTIARPPAESQMKEFRPLHLGAIRLEKGRGLLTLRALEIPGASVMDMRQLVLALNQ